ncbi:MAG: hypothetical protein ACJAVK_001138, partial [Akkermansiaceae bacterium]
TAVFILIALAIIWLSRVCYRKAAGRKKTAKLLQMHEG